MIRFASASVRYGTRQVLGPLDLDIASGERVLLTGPSGCGKSTLACCLNGLVPHNRPAILSGEVTVNGRSTRSTPVAELARSIGLVFQNPGQQLFNLTVAEEVGFGPRSLGLREAVVHARVQRALERLGVDSLAERHTTQLSAGERQRVAIAAVLAMEPRVVALDEPTANLDPAGCDALVGCLDEHHRHRGTTVMLIEHRLAEVGRLAERVVILDRGAVVDDVRRDQLHEREALLRQLGLRRPPRGQRSRWLEQLAPPPPPGGRPLVELQGVEVAYGERRVLTDLTLAIHEGDFTALVGQNGTGKTTLARLLAGFVAPRRGRVVRHGAGRFLTARDVGVLFQEPLHQLLCDTVGEDVAYGPRNLGCHDTVAVQDLLARLDLLDLEHRRVHGLSSGQRQRTALAAVLSLSPRLIILDEPTLGQDWKHLSAMMDLLTELNRRGHAILLITHDHKLVHRYARRVLVLEHGRLVKDGAPTATEYGQGAPYALVGA